MKTIRQLFRQPLKTILGILLSALAAAVLCISVGQSISAGQIHQQVIDQFSTQALPNTSYSKEADAWAIQYAQDHPEVVTAVGNPGLISGYLPGIVPDSYTSHLGLQKNLNENYLYSTSPEYVTEYGYAILEFRLDQIGDTTEEGYQILRGTILQVVEMNESHADPTEYSIQIHWDGDGSNLAVGGTYLLYTDSYTDLDWKLRSELSQQISGFSQLIEPQTASRLSIMEDYDLQTLNFCTPDGQYALSTDQIGSILITYDASYISDGKTYASTQSESLRITERNLYSFRTVFCVVEQGNLVALKANAQEFLDSPDGTVWQKPLSDLEVNNHAYPFLGVDSLLDIQAFTDGAVTFSQGRGFTDDELSQGAMVCLISAELAELNGLKVGDTISPQFYERVPDLGAGITEGYGVVNPQANPYDSDSCQLEDPVCYTIVGIYQQSSVRESKVTFGKKPGLALDGTNVYGMEILGISCQEADTHLAQYSEEVISWFPGYSMETLRGNEFVCVIPRSLMSADRNEPVTVTVTTWHTQKVQKFDEKNKEYYWEDRSFSQTYSFTVVGVHDASETVIYCPAESILQLEYEWYLSEVDGEVQVVVPDSFVSDSIYMFAGTEIPAIYTEGIKLLRISGILSDNFLLDSIWDVADNWFAEPNPEGKRTIWDNPLFDLEHLEHQYYDYALRIEDDQFRAVEETLRSNVVISTVCTVIIFALSVAASYLIAFLMIRSKRRDIMLMRTLGATPGQIYQSFVKEQMIQFLKGVAIGGLIFLWQAPLQLGALILIFYLGLRTALQFFLSKNLMTIQKADE